MSAKEKITRATLAARKRAGRKFAVLTCYDFGMAQMQAEAGVECLLVGDSAAQVILGHPSTLPATMDFMLTLAASVRRGAPFAYLIGDMPYLSFGVTRAETIRNAGRFMSEGGCDAVKIEGDGRMADTIASLAALGIPVVAHLGLRPQSVHLAGGYRAVGRDAASARRLIDDARRVADAGACMILLEAVAQEAAKIITRDTPLPVIGCGAGPHCDAHVVVVNDLLGLTAGPRPRFVKTYGDLRPRIVAAMSQYGSDVASGAYPGAEHGYAMEPGEAEKLSDG